MKESPSLTVPLPSPKPVRVTVNVAEAVPVALKSTVRGFCASIGALVLTVPVATLAPAEVGLDCTNIVQVAKAASCPMQAPGLTSEKSVPGMVNPVTLTVAALVFEMVTGRFGGVDVPACTVPKVRPPGLTETVGVTVELKLIGTNVPVEPLAALQM